MDEIIQFLRSAEVLIGAIIAVPVAMIAFAAWIDKKMAAANASAGKASARAARTITTRLDGVEGRIDALEQDHRGMRNKLGQIEVHVAQLATREDVGKLSQRVAAAEGHLTQIGGKVDTIYRAALDGGGRSS